MIDESTNMGGLLTKWRKAAGLSQGNMADALGTQQARVRCIQVECYAATRLSERMWTQDVRRCWGDRRCDKYGR